MNDTHTHTIRQQLNLQDVRVFLTDCVWDAKQSVKMETQQVCPECHRQVLAPRELERDRTSIRENHSDREF